MSGFFVARSLMTPRMLSTDFSQAREEMLNQFVAERVFIPYGNPRDTIYAELNRVLQEDNRNIYYLLVGWRLYYQLTWDREKNCRVDVDSISTPAGKVLLVVTEDYPDICWVVRRGVRVRPGREVGFDEEEVFTATITKEEMNNG